MDEVVHGPDAATPMRFNIFFRPIARQSPLPTPASVSFRNLDYLEI
jgi:hypothetical protein